MLTSTKHVEHASSKNTGSVFFQPKLTVNAPGDAYEQEADSVADQVMRMKEGDTPIVQRMPLTPVAPVQRKCTECEKEEKEKIQRQAMTPEGTVQRKCAECEKEEKEQVQRKETGGQAGSQTAPSIVSSVLTSGGGQPMDTGTRQFMESRFGQDFGQVRIHTDGQAAESAAAIQARAYTSGRNIVFGKGEYQPGSENGRRLLAHELAHVGQQGKLRTSLDVQRKVTEKNVSCAKYPKSYPIFKVIKTTDPLGDIQKTDTRAIELLDNTILELQAGIDYVKAGNPPSWPGISDCVAMALKYQMLINPDDPKSWTGTGPLSVAHVINRFKKLKQVFEGGFVSYVCISQDCKSSWVAFVWGNQTNYNVKLCPLFWDMGNDDRALSLIHELSHVYFKTEDWGYKGAGAAHCLEQFIASIHNIPVPSGFQDACNYISLKACH